MADGRAKFEWGIASSLMALLANLNRDPKRGKPLVLQGRCEMPDIVNPAYAVERLRILAEDIREVAGWMRDNHPREYESLERLGMLEHAARVFLEEEK